jgi:hypothetical protein
MTVTTHCSTRRVAQMPCDQQEPPDLLFGMTGTTSQKGRWNGPFAVMMVTTDLQPVCPHQRFR